MKTTLPYLSVIALVILVAASYYRPSSPTKIKKTEKIIQPIAPPPVENTIRAYDQYLTEHINNGAAPGAAIAFVYEGKVVWQKGYGYKDVNTKQTIDEHSVFRLASLSKGFAGILTGQLVADSTLTWNEKIVDHLDGFHLHNNEYTNELNISHILSNSSGFPHHTYTNLLEAGVDFKEIQSLLSTVKLHAAPGEYYAYQNVVFNLITPIIEKVSNISYSQNMIEYVFEPIGMKDASIGFEAIQSQTNIAKPHVFRDSSWVAVPIEKDFYTVPAAAGVNASIADMSQWLLALLGHQTKTISKQVLQDVFSPIIQTDKVRYRSWDRLKKAYYGMGWRSFHYGNYQMIYHGGFVKGYRNELFILPEEDFGFVLLTNGMNSFSHFAAPNILDRYEEEQLKYEMQMNIIDSTK